MRIVNVKTVDDLRSVIDGLPGNTIINIQIAEQDGDKSETTSSSCSKAYLFEGQLILAGGSGLDFDPTLLVADSPLNGKPDKS